MSKDKLYLTHIIECIEKIEDYTRDGKDFFESDSKTQDAVLRNLHTLSESSTHVSSELQLKYPSVAWREIHAFRNVVVHDYLGLELNQIWDIIMIDLLELKETVTRMLKELQ
ncbi:MAG: HepT-like ribonuclease domain-containing protein [Ignavibacteriota bacterium]